jgi:hypothetical protein
MAPVTPGRRRAALAVAGLWAGVAVTFAHRLESERPVVVDGVGQPTRAALRRFLPRTAEVLETRYRVLETFGSYVVLDR